MPSNYSRSSELLAVEDSVVVMIDMQEKLLPGIVDADRLTWNVGRLVGAAEHAGLPTLVTEQYPRGLGATVPALATAAEKPFEKTCFSCHQLDAFRDELIRIARPKVVLCGIETHVCVLQSAFDLVADGFHVYIAVDAVGARHAVDHQVALRRLEGAGVTLASVESCLFEWCQSADSDLFKSTQALVKDQGPRNG